MSLKRYSLTLAILLLALVQPLSADGTNCVTLSSGSVTYVAGGTQIAGLACIGSSTNGAINMVAGISRCMGAGTCLLGDVDHNGVINGADIDNFVRVKLTNTGTPYELCASNLATDAFADLLLQQP